VLRELAVADRDLRWTEWIRATNEPSWPQRHGAIQREVEAISRRWRERSERDEADRLRSLWVSWLLTSTDRPLRDHATEALYRDAAAELEPLWQTAFAGNRAPRTYRETSRRGQEIQLALRMDFENYTVGGLYDDRSNYDRKHRGYLAGLAEIRGRIWQLGWR